jgi:hypothetical protein
VPEGHEPVGPDEQGAPSEISLSRAQSPYGSSYVCPGPTTTVAMSTSCASAARSQPSPPMPVRRAKRPLPTVSRVDTVRVPEVSHACGMRAPGREVGRWWSSGSWAKVSAGVPSGTTASEA